MIRSLKSISVIWLAVYEKLIKATPHLIDTLHTFIYVWVLPKWTLLCLMESMSWIREWWSPYYNNATWWPTPWRPNELLLHYWVCILMINKTVSIYQLNNIFKFSKTIFRFPYLFHKSLMAQRSQKNPHK